ncbi:MAG: 4Fe-4S binding protein, partial [Chloroflexi bacterium]|nr:4Fe-4S binding protein [Chloroflexota bacterium]
MGSIHYRGFFSNCLHNLQNALSLDPVKGIITNTILCNFCGECATVCPSKALEMSGQEMTVEQ